MSYLKARAQAYCRHIEWVTNPEGNEMIGSEPAIARVFAVEREQEIRRLHLVSEARRARREAPPAPIEVAHGRSRSHMPWWFPHRAASYARQGASGS